MLKKRAISSLLSGLLVLGCASAQAQDEAEEAVSPPRATDTAPEEARTADESRSDEPQLLERRRRDLERSRIPHLRSELARVERQLANRAREIQGVRRSLQQDLDAAADAHARLVDQRDALTAKGFGPKSPEMVQVQRQLQESQDRLQELRDHWNGQQAQLEEARRQILAARTEAERALAAAHSERTILTDRLARVAPRSRPPAGATSGHSFGRDPLIGRGTGSGGRGGAAPFVPGQGQAPGHVSDDVRRRLDGLEQAIHEMRRLFERHGVHPEARERGERRFAGRWAPERPRGDRRPTGRAAEDRDRPFATSPTPPPGARSGSRDTAPRPNESGTRSALLRLLEREVQGSTGASGLSPEEREELRTLSQRLIELIDKKRARGKKSTEVVPEPGEPR